eukprot:366326-Chlamydomonas_euryale.AAC.3
MIYLNASALSFAHALTVYLGCQMPASSGDVSSACGRRGSTSPASVCTVSVNDSAMSFDSPAACSMRNSGDVEGSGWQAGGVSVVEGVGVNDSAMSFDSPAACSMGQRQRGEIRGSGWRARGRQRERGGRCERVRSV